MKKLHAADKICNICVTLLCQYGWCGLKLLILPSGCSVHIQSSKPSIHLGYNETDCFSVFTFRSLYPVQTTDLTIFWVNKIISLMTRIDVAEIQSWSEVYTVHFPTHHFMQNLSPAILFCLLNKIAGSPRINAFGKQNEKEHIPCNYFLKLFAEQWFFFFTGS